MRRWLLLLTGCLIGVAQATPTESPVPVKAYLTLIIDDLGQNLPRDRRVLALPGPVTPSIMPDTRTPPNSPARPMPPARSSCCTCPWTRPPAFRLASRTALDELKTRLAAAFKAVPFTSGINNHEGSRMTAEPLAMAWLMGELQRRNKFFVDSRTSAKTVAAAEAQKIGLASVSRDVFLDNERTEPAITAQLEEAIRLARKHGSAVVIGHPYPQTLAVLERELPKLKEQGIDWIDIKSMIALRGNQASEAHGKQGIYR
ncbi:divergent polysaccharide deacetylase family protein [Pseudomonas sp. PCH446]